MKSGAALKKRYAGKSGRLTTFHCLVTSLPTFTSMFTIINFSLAICETNRKA